MYSIGPDARTDLVIFFKSDVSEQDIDLFWRDVLSVRHPEGRGYDHIEGVTDILRVQAVQGHEGIALRYSATTSQERRNKVKLAVTSSSIVYKIKENIIPKNVKTLD